MGFEWVAADSCDDARADSHQFGRLLDLWRAYVDTGVEPDGAPGVPSLLGEAIPDGDGEIDQILSPEHARQLADWLDVHADALTALAVARGSMPANVREAAAWLRWAAAFGPIAPSM